MTGFLKDWIISIAIISIEGGFFLMICPNGEMKKNVKLVLSLFVLLVIISPFFGGKMKISEKEIIKEINKITKIEKTEKKALEGSLSSATLVLENEIRSRFTEDNLFYSYVKADISIENDAYVIKALTLYTKQEEREKAEDILINKLKTDRQCIIVKELE